MTSAGYLRFPHLHGELITFVAEDDVWLGPVAGGRARRVSADQAQASNPRFARDGTMIAWTGRRDGIPEVYLAGVDGGNVRRVSFLGDPQTRVCGWTPAGQILAVTASGQPFSHFTWAYAIPADTPDAYLPGSAGAGQQAGAAGEDTAGTGHAAAAPGGAGLWPAGTRLLPVWPGRRSGRGAGRRGPADRQRRRATRQPGSATGAVRRAGCGWPARPDRELRPARSPGSSAGWPASSPVRCWSAAGWRSSVTTRERGTCTRARRTAATCAGTRIMMAFMPATRAPTGAGSSTSAQATSGCSNPWTPQRNPGGWRSALVRRPPGGPRVSSRPRTISAR